MKKIFYTNLLLGTLLLISTGCGSPQKGETSENEKENSMADWTIMVFINGDNNLEPCAIADFLEMAKVGSTNKVNLIAQMDLIGKYQNIGWKQALRFRITKGMKPEKRNALMDLGEVNMGKQEVLSDFVGWAAEKYPAKKLALIVWDHGQGYRLMTASKELLKNGNTGLLKAGKMVTLDSMAANKETDAHLSITVGDPFRSAFQSPFKSCSNDETNKDELYNREIQDGLLNTLKGKKLDMLGFDACLMGMVETGYAMRNVCSNMVGSEDLEPGNGWDYSDWAAELVAKPEMDGKELSKVVVESYSRTYNGYPTTTLSAIAVQDFENVAGKISALADELKNSLATDLPAIQAAREECFVFAPNPYSEEPPRDYFFHIDFIRFCDMLIEKTQNEALKAKAVEARDAVALAVIGNYKGSERAGEFGSNGLAIYFPASYAQYKRDPFEMGGYKKDNKLFPVEFVQKHTWADFLHAYFQQVPDSKNNP